MSRVANKELAITYNEDDIMSAMNIQFSKWLMNKLIEKGWSQAELAYKAGVSRTAISDVISEKRSAGTELCRAIARAFNLPPELIFRKAGLLPAAPDNSPTLESINYKLSLLPESEQERILEFVDFLLERRERHVDRAVGSRQVESTP